MIIKFFRFQLPAADRRREGRRRRRRRGESVEEVEEVEKRGEDGGEVKNLEID